MQAFDLSCKVIKQLLKGLQRNLNLYIFPTSESSNGLGLHKPNGDDRISSKVIKAELHSLLLNANGMPLRDDTKAKCLASMLFLNSDSGRIISLLKVK